MSHLHQYLNCYSRIPDRSSPETKKLHSSPLAAASYCSSFWGRNSGWNNNNNRTKGVISIKTTKKSDHVRVYAKSEISGGGDGSSFKMNLNEYMVTLEKPLGIRFAISVDGKVFVHSLKKGGNAEKSRIIMVGDTLKKAGDSSGGRLVEIRDFGDTEKMRKEKTGLYSLVLERPLAPFQIQELNISKDVDISFNRGRVPVTTWNKIALASNLQACSDGNGSSGFATFSSKYLTSHGWNLLSNQNRYVQPQVQKNTLAASITPIVCLFSDEEAEDAEWTHGSFPLEAYVMALERSKDELYYNHSLGMQYSKITEQIYAGSCIQTEADVETLSNVVGVTAVLNFQSGTEAQNWEVNYKLVNESCEANNVLMINYPIREADSFDMRKKLPFCVGLLLRLLKRKHRVYITCTTGFDRSPACIIAYLHWVADTSLHEAYNYVTGLHSCRPDRAAIAWATWDLIAMVEKGVHDGPPTHAVTFVWNGHEGEEVSLIGDFTNNWKEPVRVVHKGGPRFEAEIRLSQGKYYYKFVTSGHWRHSNFSPTERDDSGNLNNVIIIGDVASVRPSINRQKKDANIVKVIERPLTENERFMLAKAARCIAFSVCPIRLAPK